jgi:hypothetical protein
MQPRTKTGVWFQCPFTGRRFTDEMALHDSDVDVYLFQCPFAGKAIRGGMTQGVVVWFEAFQRPFAGKAIRGNLDNSRLA